MEKEDTLEALLQRATVRVDLDLSPAGTGFFAGPGLILTCAHVIRPARQGQARLHIFWQGQSFEAAIRSMSPEHPDAGTDLALLAVSFHDHPCVLLCGEARPYSPLYSYGYPSWAPDGSAVTFTTAGPAGEHNQWITFQHGPVDRGLSGAPLLDRDSGSVCGMIQFSLGLNSERGGQGLQARIILDQFAELAEAQVTAHRRNLRWLETLSIEQRQQLRQRCPQYLPLLQQSHKALKVFISYSNEARDQQLCKELLKHLAGLRRAHLIESYHSGQLSAGREQSESQRWLEQADIILLLISPDYIADEQCYNEEMQRAMQRHEDGTARVIPIRLRPTEGLANSPFGKLQALPLEGPAITERKNRDQAFAEIAAGLRQVIKELKGEQP
ncbi:trypsin-like peptidase domain-containing protein [Thermogemmatispora sp.]|uniref:trypsin-like peptidase domain-containing protein n=1 Tax=Thermogemmatispora sp. TaxID=1968838 RepID=UPI001D54A4A2|nr:trypsin-like peptidase domain-containing protein [Thermogemmatispora sp.]MBX5449140.1 trypsin-like peptidase domain-containing protein [Thermogemmatispora sp.]